MPRCSELLKKQIIELQGKAIQSDQQLQTGNIKEVIKLLEGEARVVESIRRYAKVPGAFKGVLAPYLHAHVPIEIAGQGSYLSLFFKDWNDDCRKFRSKFEALIKERAEAALELSVSDIEALVPRDASVPGRMTGYWLVYECIDGVNYYYGLFPHGRGRADDVAYRLQIEEAKAQLHGE
ncbi:hypothetical protein N9449_07320 [Oceanospirillaceae bacterium]|nr:hypothetical protein [Oceanospirillaceae bacterium]